MANDTIKTNPTSPGRRFVIKLNKRNLSKKRPHKALITKRFSTGGRNNLGRITVRHRGSGHKRLYRLIDFKRNKFDVPAIVESIEYDPNRTANIALLLYKDGERRYIIAPRGLKEGGSVVSAPNDLSIPVKVGNSMTLSVIPIGTVVHAVELQPGKGAQLARSAGSFVRLVSKEGEKAVIRLRSGEMRMVQLSCRATIGEVGNIEHNLISLGKAGAKRWRGFRPTVRGVAMNPVDHPHGGGEGKTSGGRHPVSPWGTPTKGYKTRNNKRTNVFIIKNRHQSGN